MSTELLAAAVDGLMAEVVTAAMGPTPKRKQPEAALERPSIEEDGQEPLEPQVCGMGSRPSWQGTSARQSADCKPLT